MATQCKCLHVLSPAVDLGRERGQTMRASLRLVDCCRFVALSNITESNIDRLFELKLKQAGTLARPYDTVVRAMGWKHNASMYGEGAQPLLQSQKKYARMTVRLHLTTSITSVHTHDRSPLLTQMAQWTTVLSLCSMSMNRLMFLECVRRHLRFLLSICGPWT